MQLILFDIDGTLINAGDSASRAFHQAFSDLFGCPPNSQGVTTHGATDPQISQAVALNTLQRSLTPAESAELDRQYLHNLQQQIAQSSDYQVLPGVKDLLETLSVQQDQLLGLQTGNLEDGALIKLQPHNLHNYFKLGGFGSDSAQRHELIAIAIQRAEQKLQMPFSRVFTVGDTPQDIHAGRQAGAITVAVATGIYTESQLAEHQPDHLVADFADLPALLSIFGVH